ncbi:hypothetical protein HN937_17170 [Candidatus Poribacteria bacterium]|nr:hypothetical protein [Candidatus Poribacteria bacterium]
MTRPTIFSWSTSKTPAGFAFKVTRNTPTKTPCANGHYCVTETIKTGAGYATRARAKSAALKWRRYLAAA